MEGTSKIPVFGLVIVLLITSLGVIGCEDSGEDVTEAKLAPTEVATQEPTSTPVAEPPTRGTTPTIEPTAEPPSANEYVPMDAQEMFTKLMDLRDSNKQKSATCWNTGDAQVGRDFFQRSGPVVEAVKRGKIVTEVAPRTWFIQMGISQMSLFETDEGLVLVDTGGACHGPALLETIRELSDKPMHTAIYTHAHIDHAYGLWAFEEAGELPPNIIAHEETPNWFHRYLRLREFYCRMNTQKLENWPDDESDFIWPTQTYEDTLELEIGGERFILNHDRGETDDQTWVWVPDRRVICSADFYVGHLGNLGNAKRIQRYPEEAAIALEKMADVDAEVVLPGHGDAIYGSENIRTIFLNMAEIWKSIVEQTIDGLNAGLPPDAIFRSIELPEELADYPPASPCYASVEDISRMVIKQYSGWWDLIPADLDPAPLQEQALEIAKLAGGIDVLMDRALELVNSDIRMSSHYAQWAYNADPSNVRAQDVMFQVFYERGMQEEQDVDRTIILVDALLPLIEERTGTKLP